MTARDKARRAIWAAILEHQQGTRLPPRYELAHEAEVCETIVGSELATLKDQGVLHLKQGRPAIVIARIRKPKPGDLFAEVLIGDAYFYVCMSCWNLVTSEAREAHGHDR